MTTQSPPRPRFQPGWTIHVTLKRLWHEWRSVVTMSAGILLATIIGASIPLYTSALGQIGLQQTLANAERSVAHIALRTGITRITQAAGDEMDLEARAALSAQLGDWIAEIVRWEETLPLPPERNGEVIPATRLRLGNHDNWEERVVVEDGRLPSTMSPADNEVEAVASLALAQALGLHSGDELVLRDGRESSRPIHVRVTGLVKPASPEDPYWPQGAPPMQPAEPVGQWQVQGTLLISQQSLYSLAISHLPETTTGLGWRLILDHPAITLEEIPAIRGALGGLSERLESLQASFISVETGLDPLLAEYAVQAKLLGAPFGLIIIQIGALTLFFLLVTAELVRRYERREISLIRSRGGDEGQVWVLRAMEALVICLVMIAAGPVIAHAGLRHFGNLGPLRGLEIGVLPLAITPVVFAYAAGAGLTGWIVLMITMRPALRASLVSAAGARDRPGRRSWWQRYHIDTALLVLGGIAYWQLSSYGSVFVRRMEGEGLIIDPLLLLTPSLLMLAVGALMLRAFGPAVRLLAYLLARRDGLTAQLAGWQISRRPVHYGRIALMLALAVGMGWFATSFNATVVRNQADRAVYAAGADLRLAQADTLLGLPRTHALETYSDLDDVKQASIAFRSRINASTQHGRSVPGELLGIDSRTFGLTANWREDLGILVLPGTSGSEPTAAGRIIAPTPHRLGMWLNMPDEDAATVANRLAVSIKVQDDNGVLANLPLEIGRIDKELVAKIPDNAYEQGSVYEPTGWVYAEVDITQARRPLVAPLRLCSIHWSYRSPSAFVSTNELILADLVVYDRLGNQTPLDWLDSLAGWRFLDDGISPSEGSIDTTHTRRGSGDRPLKATWLQEGRTSAVGLVIDDRPAGTLSAVVSTSFLQANGLSGQEPFYLNVLGSRLVFRVAAVMDNYPSLYSSERPYLVTDRDRLLHALNHRPSATVFANEVWIRMSEPGNGGAILDALEKQNDGLAVQNSWEAVELERRMQANPLTIGLTGLFFIAFGVALVLTAVSLLSYVALTARARRVEFSVLQSLGLTPRRLLVSLGLEQGMVMVAGVLAGAGLGALLGRQILPFLSVTEAGKAIVPPFIVETGVDLLLQYGMVLLAVFTLLMLSSLWLLRQLPLARTLRLGDE